MFQNIAIIVIVSVVSINCYYEYSEKFSNVEVPDIPLSSIKKKYDFIIVGGGTAGCVIAARLSEIKEWDVLLLEAGGEEVFAVEVPLLSFITYKYLSWNYSSVPQDSVCKTNGGRCTEYSGKVLGGSLAINAMNYVRGIPKDYDDWEAMRNKGWGWNDVKKYFILSENNTDPEFAKDKRNHGTGGPLTIGSNVYLTELANPYVEAGKYFGYPEVDLTGDYHIGIMLNQHARREGKRCTTNKGFLRPAGHRKNLHVAKNAFVTKIHFRKQKAIGVSFIKNGKKTIVKAKNEVIVSAGAHNTAKLLMLSGIGPREHLASHGIKCVADLPVGQNLQNHLYLILPFKVTRGPITKKDYLNVDAISDFFFNNSGPYTSSVGHEVITFINGTRCQKDSSECPDLMLSLAFFHPPGDEMALTIEAFLMRPKSRGHVNLKSNDPYDEPLIDPKYLSHPGDYEGTMEALEKAFKLNEAPSVAIFKPRLIRKGCCQKFGSREFKDCVIKTHSEGAKHTVSTCKMGPDGVVDVNLKVHGIESLRIADASVIPHIMTPNLFAHIVMIGEKASDIIKRCYGKPTLIQ